MADNRQNAVEDNVLRQSGDMATWRIGGLEHVEPASWRVARLTFRQNVLGVLLGKNCRLDAVSRNEKFDIEGHVWNNKNMSPRRATEKEKDHFACQHKKKNGRYANCERIVIWRIGNRFFCGNHRPGRHKF